LLVVQQNLEQEYSSRLLNLVDDLLGLIVNPYYRQYTTHVIQLRNLMARHNKVHHIL
jgi:hypothetical protein